MSAAPLPAAPRSLPPSGTRPPVAGGTHWWVILTPLVPLVALLPAGAWLLPMVAPLPVYPAFRARVREGRLLAAWGLALLWAALLAAGVIALTWYAPAAAAAGILNGEEYRREMFDWIATGEGREGDWRAFLPRHLLHLGAFILAAWLSAGYLGLALGAALLDYMAYFTASFGQATGEPVRGMLAAWVPWSLVRILSFVLLGSLFSRPLIVRRFWPWSRAELRLLLIGLAGIAADLVLKAWLAPAYGQFLRELVRRAAGD